MQTLRLILIAVISSVSTLVLAAGCDVIRSGSSTPSATTPAATAPPATTAAQAPAQSPAAAQPQAAQAPSSPAPAAQAPNQAAQPAVQAQPAGAVPAVPVVQAAPGQPAAQPAVQQGGNPYDAVIRVYRDSRPSVVTVLSTIVQPGFRAEAQAQPRGGSGSGFMIDDRGHILTNNHVVEDANRLEIVLSTGQTLPAELVGRDPRFDLAVVRASIPPDQLKVVQLGDSDQVQVGEQAIAIGNPLGLEGTVTTGVVSSRRPLVEEPNQNRSGPGVGVLVNAIQTDASINPGNSGGPLFNSRGEVIGINTLGLMPGGGQAGLNFAIPINNAKRVLPDLIARGSYPHPFVGISSAEITQAMAEALSLPAREGLLIQSVEPNSGGGRAGLRGGEQQQEVRSRQVRTGGDIIVAIDGQAIKRPEDFVAYLEQNKRAGDNVTLTIVRNGQRQDVQVTLGERPSQ